MKMEPSLVFLLANAATVVGVVNPWWTAWQASGTVFLALEVAFLLLIGLAVFCYHCLRKKKPLWLTGEHAGFSSIAFIIPPAQSVFSAPVRMITRTSSSQSASRSAFLEA